MSKKTEKILNEAFKEGVETALDPLKKTKQPVENEAELEREIIRHFEIPGSVTISNQKAFAKSLAKQLSRYIQSKLQQKENSVREETLKEVLSVMLDWAWRKYPPKRVIKETSKHIGLELETLKKQ